MASEIKVFTDEEIVMLLSGDRREVDKLLLHGINNLSAALMPRMNVISELGTADTVRTRMEWIDQQIENQRLKNEAMRKIIESTVIWAVILMLGFLATSVFSSLVEVLRSKLFSVR